jgi:FkbM family methyltransferase
MRSQHIAGKLTQLTRLSLRRWPKFIRGWLNRNQTGTVPCVLPRAQHLVEVPLREFYDTYWYFSEAHQGIEEIDFFLQKLHPGDVLYDIGAFRGVYGAAAKAAFGKSISVHLFEPVPDNLAAINTVGRLNGFDDYHCVDRAVGSSRPIRGLVDAQDRMLRHADEGADVEMTELRSISVDAYSAESGTRPSVLKIDVEGFELEVLAGAEQCFQKHRPRIWLELHPQHIAAQGHRWEDAVDFLTARSYRVTNFKDCELSTRDLGFHIWAEACSIADVS